MKSSSNTISAEGKFNNAIAILDYSKIENRFFKDPVFLEEILNTFSNTAKSCLQDIRAARANKNAVLLANSAHKLLGSAMNFSNGYIVNYLQQLETDARENGFTEVPEEDVNKLSKSILDMNQQLHELCETWKQ